MRGLDLISEVAPRDGKDDAGRERHADPEHVPASRPFYYQSRPVSRPLPTSHVLLSRPVPTSHVLYHVLLLPSGTQIQNAYLHHVLFTTSHVLWHVLILLLLLPVTPFITSCYYYSRPVSRPVATSHAPLPFTCFRIFRYIRRAVKYIRRPQIQNTYLHHVLFTTSHALWQVLLLPVTP